MNQMKPQSSPLANQHTTRDDTGVENVLEDNGIDPPSARKDGTSWSDFLAAHWDCLGTIDFTKFDV